MNEKYVATLLARKRYSVATPNELPNSWFFFCGLKIFTTEKKSLLQEATSELLSKAIQHEYFSANVNMRLWYIYTSANVHVWRIYLDIKYLFYIIFCYFNFYVLELTATENTGYTIFNIWYNLPRKKNRFYSNLLHDLRIQIMFSLKVNIHNYFIKY